MLENQSVYHANVFLFIELGSPTAEFQWFKATNQNSVGSGRELTIVPGKVMDTDRYRCRARNSVGHKDSEPILVKFYGE